MLSLQLSLRRSLKFVLRPLRERAFLCHLSLTRRTFSIKFYFPSPCFPILEVFIKCPKKPLVKLGLDKKKSIFEDDIIIMRIKITITLW